MRRHKRGTPVKFWDCCATVSDLVTSQILFYTCLSHIKNMAYFRPLGIVLLGQEPSLVRWLFVFNKHENQKEKNEFFKIHCASFSSC